MPPQAQQKIRHCLITRIGTTRHQSQNIRGQIVTRQLHLYCLCLRLQNRVRSPDPSSRPSLLHEGLIGRLVIEQLLLSPVTAFIIWIWGLHMGSWKIKINVNLTVWSLHRRSLIRDILTSLWVIYGVHLLTSRWAVVGVILLILWAHGINLLIRPYYILLLLLLFWTSMLLCFWSTLELSPASEECQLFSRGDEPEELISSFSPPITILIVHLALNVVFLVWSRRHRNPSTSPLQVH